MISFRNVTDEQISVALYRLQTDISVDIKFVKSGKYLKTGKMLLNENL